MEAQFISSTTPYVDNPELEYESHLSVNKIYCVPGRTDSRCIFCDRIGALRTGRRINTWLLPFYIEMMQFKRGTAREAIKIPDLIIGKTRGPRTIL